MANHKGQSRRRSIRRRFKIVAFSFFLVIFLLSSTMALKTVIESSKAKSGYSELQALMRQEEYENTVVATGNEVEAAITNEMELNVTEKSAVVEAKEPITIKRQKTSVDFSALKEINPDIIGWIRAEGTNIDYPIAQTDNNEYYLSHLYNKEWNSSGTIFADYRNTGDFSDRNTVIYGHHMKNETMFHALEEYKDQDFYDANPTMMLFTPDGDYIIELICGSVEDGNYQFVKFDFDSEESFVQYIEEIQSRSTFASDVELHPGDKIVSLCTCSYEWTNARFMVIGRLVPIMEAVN